MSLLNESLDHMDMEGMIKPEISIDEYAAKSGKDRDVITLTFVANSKLAADDLARWFERGYTFVLDASVSDGEISPGRYLVFVELKRRSRAPERICTLLSELDTLTGTKLRDWTVVIETEEYVANEDNIRENLILNPGEYTADREEQYAMNEYRELAGLEPEPLYADKQDSYIKDIKAIAGL